MWYVSQDNKPELAFWVSYAQLCHGEEGTALRHEEGARNEDCALGRRDKKTVDLSNFFGTALKVKGTGRYGLKLQCSAKSTLLKIQTV